MRNPIGPRLKHVRATRNQTAMAEALGMASRTYANYERDERVPDAEALARLVEEGWNANWLLTGEGPERLSQFQIAEAQASYASHEMSGERLSVAAELADEALTGLWLPRRPYYDLVALIYDALVQGLPYAEIIAFARPAAKQMAGDKSDDSGAEVGGTGAENPGGGASGRDA